MLINVLQQKQKKKDKKKTEEKKEVEFLPVGWITFRSNYVKLFLNSIHQKILLSRLSFVYRIWM